MTTARRSPLRPLSPLSKLQVDLESTIRLIVPKERQHINPYITLNQEEPFFGVLKQLVVVRVISTHEPPSTSAVLLAPAQNETAIQAAGSLIVRTTSHLVNSGAIAA